MKREVDNGFDQATETMQRIAGAVRLLATEFDLILHRQDLSLSHIALLLQDAVGAVNSEIRRVTMT